MDLSKLPDHMAERIRQHMLESEKAQREDGLADLILRYPEFNWERATYPHSNVPPGWVRLVDDLCADLRAMMAHISGHLHVNQVKEKMGTLRFRGHIARVDEPEEKDRRIVCTDAIAARIQAAEVMSATACQVCGEVGQLHSDGGLLITLCRIHSY